MNPLDLVNKLAKEEQEGLNKPFLAPCLPGAPVRIRFGMTPYTLRVFPRNTQGWQILKVSSKLDRAQVDRRATQAEITAYLSLFPRARFVVVESFEGQWFGLLAGKDKRFKIQGPIPLRLAERVNRFDTVYARFDGSQFWFEGPDRRRELRVARELFQALNQKVLPENLQVSGSTPEEHLVYAMLYIQEYQENPAEPTDNLGKARRTLERVGANLQKYWETGKSQSTVQFTLDGRSHTVTMDRSSFQIISSGICLVDHRTGIAHDKDFDLSSICSVFREQYSRTRGQWGDDD